MATTTAVVQGQKRVLNARRTIPTGKEVFLPRRFSMSHVTKNDIIKNGPPIYDQGDKGSCTAHGWARAFEYIQLSKLAQKLESPFEFAMNAYVAASRRFLYYMEGVIEGDVGQDNGAQIGTGGDVIGQYGLPQESHWPYDPDGADFFQEPSADVMAEASQHTGHTAFKLQDLGHIMQSIDEGYPVVCGLTLYDSFMSDAVAQTGTVPMPMRYESVQGGHCVTIVGYDKEARTLTLANSWGTGWGKNGYFTLPFAYAESNMFFDPNTLRPDPA